MIYGGGLFKYLPDCSQFAARALLIIGKTKSKRIIRDNRRTHVRLPLTAQSHSGLFLKYDSIEKSTTYNISKYDSQFRYVSLIVKQTTNAIHIHDGTMSTINNTSIRNIHTYGDEVRSSTENPWLFFFLFLFVRARTFSRRIHLRRDYLCGGFAILSRILARARGLTHKNLLVLRRSHTAINIKNGMFLIILGTVCNNS